MLSTSLHGTSQRPTIETLLALSLAAAVIATCIGNKWFDALCMMILHNEVYQLDEIVGSFVVLLILFIFLFARRGQHLRVEARLLKARNAQNSEAARRDFLTGAANRLAMAEWFAARRGGAVTFILLDLDGFKAINDSFGHAAGDAVLVELARRLRHALEQSSGALVVRMGGDEFGCLIARASDAVDGMAAIAVAHSLDQPIAYGGTTLRITASMGIADGEAEERSLDALLQEADAAMYCAKLARRRRQADAMPLAHSLAAIL